MIEYTCRVCGITFQAPPYPHRKCCSPECLRVSRHKTATAVCPQCGKVFKTDSSTPSKHCSKECRYAARSYTRECLTCGKAFFKPRHPSAIYCSRECWKIARKGETAYCIVCGVELPTGRPTYCSKDCRLAAAWNNRDPSKKTIKQCKWCGEEFESWTYRNTVYCSNQCKSEYGAHQPKPNARRPDSFVTKACTICGKEYRVHKCQDSNGRSSRFCSAKCRHQALSIERIGAANPNYSGGTKYPDRGTNWCKQRRAAVSRDGKLCQRCHKKARRLEVHHIIPYAKFGGNYEVANKLSNLITLCRACHALIEFHEVPCPQRLL